jgi:hypothetical protein
MSDHNTNGGDTNKWYEAWLKQKSLRRGVVEFVLGAVIGFVVGHSTLVILDVKSDQEKVIKSYMPGARWIQDEYFSIRVPKGWSVSYGSLGEKFKSSVTATPTDGVVHDTTFIGVHVKKEPPKETLERFYETKWKPRLKPGDKQTFVTWQGQRWLLWEYACQSVAKEDARCWAGKAIANGQDVLMLAGTPTHLVATFVGQLTEIMQSVTFHPVTERTLYATPTLADRPLYEAWLALRGTDLMRQWERARKA